MIVELTQEGDRLTLTDMSTEKSTTLVVARDVAYVKTFLRGRQLKDLERRGRLLVKLPDHFRTQLIWA